MIVVKDNGKGSHQERIEEIEADWHNPKSNFTNRLVCKMSMSGCVLALAALYQMRLTKNKEGGLTVTITFKEKGKKDVSSVISR